MHNTLGSFTWGARHAGLFYVDAKIWGDTKFPVTPVTSLRFARPAEACAASQCTASMQLSLWGSLYTEGVVPLYCTYGSLYTSVQ